ncbi:MAG: urocanate hydratase [Proteobacteria bacterium]|jgi:urocanate hydratase|nr:urocanate hydratase [Pseudomonadota bacterium]
MSNLHDEIRAGIPNELPAMPPEEPGVNRAPKRPQVLDERQRRQAVANALRYFPESMHAELAPELARELATDGRIYVRRLRPDREIKARPISEYPARCAQAAAIMLMIENNLDKAVAQHPYELITYGGNGAVFQNWAQYRLAMRYLSEMTDQQTLVLYSGHPLGLFPSHPDAPRVVVTNGMMIPNHSTRADYDVHAALGVTSYGQMTAGSFMYIGPQGIVHGTTITLLNAGRLHLGLAPDEDLAGRLFVTSGLGGMSGAQPKAAVIAGAIGVVAEVNPKALKTRHDQGWLEEYETDLDKVLRRVERARKERRPLSLGYLGNVVDLWERLAAAGAEVELGSDQTSLHNPFLGGYYPAGMTLEASNRMMVDDPAGFRERVYESLRRHVAAIDALAARGMYFWDYGNAFLLEAGRAKAPGVVREDGSFKYPSYVEDIMGPMCFDYGFGPFRWVCCTGRDEDLAATDAIAAAVLEKTAATAAPEVRQQMLDNVRWIRRAKENALVVGSKARILYADRQGRIDIALAFNDAIAGGRVSGPIVLGRDHHDVSGTDSPYRETSNIRDGSKFTADMAVQNFVGDAFRGATWVSLHNGGGVGWGEVINGGFGMLLDGSADAGRRARMMLSWDVSNGLARRAWAGNDGAIYASQKAMASEPGMNVTLPNKADTALVDDAVRLAFGDGK